MIADAVANARGEIDVQTLSAAAARNDGCAVIPTKVNKAAATKVGASLVARKLMREAKAKPDEPVWRIDQDRPISLVITAMGRKVIGIDEHQPAAAKSAPKAQHRQELASNSSSKEPRLTAAPGDSLPSPQSGSKQAQRIAMLSAKTGASLDSLVEATGWLPHTTRAALTGLRKLGYRIERRRDGEVSIYRIVGHASAAA